MKEEKDIRFYRTQKSIIEAMVSLLEEKTFDQITVTDICKRANISRSGFYLHYVDKYDLVDQYQQAYATKALEILSSKLKENFPRKELFYKLAVLLNTEGKLMALLLSSKGSTEIQQRMKKTLREYAEKDIIPHVSNISSTSEKTKHYMSAFITNAMLGILQEWIDCGQQESPEELMEILDSIIFYDIR